MKVLGSSIQLVKTFGPAPSIRRASARREQKPARARSAGSPAQPPEETMRRPIALLAIVLPPALLALLLLWPGSLAWLTGFRPLRQLDPAALEAAGGADDKGTPRFLADRNKVELKVPREMPVGELLDLYQIRYEHIRKQIGEQLGIGRAGDDVVLAAGQKLVLELTPPGEAL